MNEYTSSLPVVISIPDKKSLTGILEIQKLSVSGRIMRAGLFSLGALFVTILMVAIPLLHFILVPFGLLCTIAIFISSFQTDKIITGGVGTCPSCNATINFVKRKFKFPYFETCATCSSDSQITQAACDPK